MTLSKEELSGLAGAHAMTERNDERSTNEQIAELILSQTYEERVEMAMKGTDPALIHPDDNGHRTRFSDSSFHDEVCVLCGATDGRGDNRLEQPCPKVLSAALKGDR